jgi:broad specificity phosphatase PhoE
MTNARKIWLTRHGESEYNQQALIGGDSPLSPNGQAYAELLPDVILSRLPKVREGPCERVLCALGLSVLVCIQ